MGARRGIERHRPEYRGLIPADDLIEQAAQPRVVHSVQPVGGRVDVCEDGEPGRGQIHHEDRAFAALWLERTRGEVWRRRAQVLEIQAAGA